MNEDLKKFPAKGLNLQPLTKTEFQMSDVILPEKPGITFGIEETKDVVAAGVALANSIIAALEDGKISLADIPVFFNPVLKLPAALSGIDKVPAELGDIDAEELNELKAIVKDQLSVSDEKAAEIIDASIAVLYDIYLLIKKIQAA